MRGKRTTSSDSRLSNRDTADTRPFAAADSLSILAHLNGEWFFETVAGKRVTGEENRPSLTFEETTARFYASNGCNYFNGDFHVTGFNMMTFDNVIMTANHCDATPWGDYISAMWNVGTRFFTSNRGTEEYLDIRDSGNRSLATLHRHALSRLNGMWTAAKINGRSIPDEKAPVIVIDLIELTIHGNTGCNLFKGSIYQNPDIDSSVQFQDMTVTRMSCPNADTERDFLVALEQVESATLSTDDLVTLLDKNRNPLLTLRRTPL